MYTHGAMTSVMLKLANKWCNTKTTNNDNATTTITNNANHIDNETSHDNNE